MPPPPAIAAGGPAGCSASALAALGFNIGDVLELVREGLATPRAERLADQTRSYDLSRLWITAAGARRLPIATDDRGSS
jgi:hypothetical protein